MTYTQQNSIIGKKKAGSRKVRNFLIRVILCVLLFFLLLWELWPLFLKLRTGEVASDFPLRQAIHEVLTQPRSAIFGTKLVIETVRGVGEKGDKGDAGFDGEDGRNGRNGGDGAKGADGNSGSSGSNGAKGDTGAAGATGATGAAGAAGSDPYAFVQNGNSYGEQAVLGTNDAYGLGFETNGTQRAFLDILGNYTVSAGYLAASRGAAFGDYSGASDIGGADSTLSLNNNMLNLQATGAYAATGANGGYSMLRMTGEYTPAPGTGTKAFNGTRTQMLVNAGDGTAVALVRGSTAAITNNSIGTLSELSGFRTELTNAGTITQQNGLIAVLTNNGTANYFNLIKAEVNNNATALETNAFDVAVTNSGTTNNRSGGFQYRFFNDGTLADVDTRTAEFQFNNLAGATSPEHYGFVSTVNNTGTMLGTANGYSAFLTNFAGATTGDLQGYRTYVTNAGTSANEVGNSLRVVNEAGGVADDVFGYSGAAINTGTTTNLYGMSIEAANTGGTAQDIYGLQVLAGNHSAGITPGVATDLYGLKTGHGTSPTSVSGTEYGIYVADAQYGAVNNYGMYIENAHNGSGTNASLWVNAGLSRFAAATTAQSSIRLQTSAGVNVASPTSGDLWWNGTALNFYNGTTTSNLLDTSCATCFVQNGNSFAGLATLGTNDTNALAFETNGGERMRILSDGKVGIGDAAPDQALVVNGNIKATNSTLGVMLNAQVGPVITRGSDLFATGTYAGAGRWGLFMESSLLTLGVANSAGSGFQFARYNDDSTIASTSLYINDAGNVGIGSGQFADARLVVEGDYGASNSVGASVRGANGNGSILGISQNGIGAWGIGLEPASGDLSFIQNRFVGNAGTEVMRLNTYGDLGIGNVLPMSRLDVADNRATGYAALFFNDGDNANRYGILVQSGESDLGISTNRLVTFQNQSGTEVGSIEYTGGTTSYNTSSDSRAKTDIAPISLSLDDLMRIKLYDYRWKMQPDSGKNYGVLAQELYQIFPQAVSKPSDPNRLWAVDYSKLVPLTIKSIQDQQTRIESLEKQIRPFSGIGKLSEGVWSFVGQVVFEMKVKFLAAVEFFGKVTFHDRVTFGDKDMAGVAMLPAGQTSVAVSFSQAYGQLPVVTASANGQVIAVAVDQVTMQGFVLKIAAPLEQPLNVSWMALVVDGVTVPSTVVPAPTLTPTPTPTVEPLPSAVPSPSPSSSPTVSPVENPAETIDASPSASSSVSASTP